MTTYEEFYLIYYQTIIEEYLASIGKIDQTVGYLVAK